MPLKFTWRAISAVAAVLAAVAAVGIAGGSFVECVAAGFIMLNGLFLGVVIYVVTELE